MVLGNQNQISFSLPLSASLCFCLSTSVDHYIYLLLKSNIFLVYNHLHLCCPPTCSFSSMSSTDETLFSVDYSTCIYVLCFKLFYDSFGLPSLTNHESISVGYRKRNWWPDKDTTPEIQKLFFLLESWTTHDFDLHHTCCIYQC